MSAIRVFLLAWSVRLGLAGLLYYLSWRGGHPGVWSFAPDAANYHDVARLIALAWQQGTDLSTISIWTDYLYVIAALYYILGASMLWPILANTLLGAGTVLLIYLLARRLLKPKWAKRVGLVLAFFPSLVLFSTQILKDPLVIFLVALVFWLSLSWLERPQIGLGVLLATAVLALAGVRWYTGAICVLALTMAGLLAKETRKGRTILLLVFLNLLAGWQAWGELHQTADLQEISRLRNQVYAIDNAALEKRDISSPGKLLQALPTGLFAFYFSPLPNQWLIGKGLIQKLNGPEMLFWYGIVLLGVYGLLLLLKRGFAGRAIAFFVVGLSLPYALVIANIGAIYRLREQLVPFLIIAAAVALQRLEVKGWPGLFSWLPWRNTGEPRK